MIESDILPADYAKFPSPCYVVEERLLRKNLALIKQVADASHTEIILAFKAFALWKTFPIFREYISHTTASSVNEALLAYKEFGSRAHTYSPAYTDRDFPTFVECSDYITFNSLSQYEHFYPQTLSADHHVSCGVRVNPEYSEIEVDLYNPCAPGSRFGLTADLLPEQLPAGIEGFHCHCHCESDSYALQRTLVHLEERFSRWFPQLKWLNLGGGHLMTRKDYDTQHLIQVLNGLHERYPNLQIILEPGSAFAWQTGPLVSQVVDVVNNHGVHTAILNVSFACHMPDCLEMPYQPTVRGAVSLPADSKEVNALDGKDENLSNVSDKFLADKKYTVYRLGGNSCLSGDFLGCWAFDHELQVGEYLLFEDMIHYTTVKTHMFNGISHPALAMLHCDHSVEILREYDYEDYKRRMD